MASLSIKIEGLNKRMVDALRYAISVIESYEMDIRNSEEICGVDLVTLGFCQGSIYTEARATIEHIIDGTFTL